jgi:hypothetical protein
VGDAAERFTGGRLRATGHRVRHTPWARASLVRFVALQPEAVVRPLPPFRGAADPYGSVTMRQHISKGLELFMAGEVRALCARDRNRQLHTAHRHVCAREITSDKNYTRERGPPHAWCISASWALMHQRIDASTVHRRIGASWQPYAWRRALAVQGAEPRPRGRAGTTPATGRGPPTTATQPARSCDALVWEPAIQMQYTISISVGRGSCDAFGFSAPLSRLPHHFFGGWGCTAPQY